MQYEEKAYNELVAWQRKLNKDPSVWSKVSKKLQAKINSYIPEKVHQAVTIAIKQMIRGVLFGAKLTAPKPSGFYSLEQTEQRVIELVRTYKKTASIEGGVTGAGGFLMGLADFPLLLGIKLKMLFAIAALYGFDVHDYKERVYILHVFELAFSSQEHRKQVLAEIIDWDEKKNKLPDDIHQFNWRSLQQEYRDYIDLAKMAQLIPGIGAVVGVVVNAKLIEQLQVAAMNAYRMRLFKIRRAL